MTKAYPATDRYARYRNKIVAKTCIECGSSFEQKIKLKGICDPCKAIRRAASRPPTFKDCLHCGERFGPVDHLDAQFCSQQCNYDHRVRTKKTVTIPKARSAQSLLAYHVKAGNIIRPSTCEECGCSDRKIEGAHFDYDHPLVVRWLCRSCHVKWDKAEPKGATYSVPLENATGNTATRESVALAAD